MPMKEKMGPCESESLAHHPMRKRSFSGQTIPNIILSWYEAELGLNPYSPCCQAVDECQRKVDDHIATALFASS